MALVKLRDGAPELTIEGLREFCLGNIAKFKIPRYLQIVDDFPMTVTGKVRKIEMRQQAIEYLGGRE
jgi:fatty-acyl-CoA synthase